jgi:hypothetical protein
MELNEGTTQLWGAAAHEVTAGAQLWVVQCLTVLGNTVERSAGSLTVPNLGDNIPAAFDAVVAKVRAAHERLGLLGQKGLPLQTLQALARTVASTAPQHIMRTTSMPAATAQEYDRIVKKCGCASRVANSIAAGASSCISRPWREDSVQAGPVYAAFLTGMLDALPEIQQAAGQQSMEGLR